MKSPLADRLRPKSLDEVVGQAHLLQKDKPLRRIIESGEIPNLIFYGPAGIGKTTVARIIAEKTDRKLHKLNATTASTADIKAIVKELDMFDGMNGILLYLDEIQSFNKRQQQSLLEYIENGQITLIASTTENPYFYIYNALLSRSTVFEFKAVESQEIEKAVKHAFDFLAEENSTEVDVKNETIQRIAKGCGGDVRKAITTAEMCFLAADRLPESTENPNGKVVINHESAVALVQKSSMRYDKSDDSHYDVISAFQKSMRGSDPDAALHYLARLLIAGDMPSACRRLMVCACEDVGLAYPQIIPIVKAAIDAALMLGMPEARIPLADAVTLVATCPKSNSAYIALDSAMADIERGNSGEIPRNLQNNHFDGEDNQNKGQHYIYTQDCPNHWAKQQYLPDAIKNKKYYTFGDNKTEQAFKDYWRKIKGE